MTDTDNPINEALAGWEPDSRRDGQRARAQTRRVAEYLRDQGEYSRKERLQETLAPESKLDQRYWWHHAVWPGLKHLADHGLVTYVTNCGYRWTGDDVAES